MKASISRIEILSVNIPLRTRFRHSAHSRSASESIFVRLHSKNGVKGYGESLPRPYVTGEDQTSVLRTLKSILPDTLLGKSFQSFDEAIVHCHSINNCHGAARCAYELALLDCAGKAFGRSASFALGGAKIDKLRYSAVIGQAGAGNTAISSLKYRAFGMRHVKIKVGDSGDIGRVKTGRRFLGPACDIRLDANGAWTAEQAVERLSAMRPYGFSAIEQPVAKADISSMKKVADEIKEPVIADESLCTVKDAEALIRDKACDMFNIRLSKCGGLLPSLKIYGMAGRAGFGCQLGCQVGETGVLSAAGRIFAVCTGDMRYLEGSYSGFLLNEDVVEQKISFGYGGMAGPVMGPGLGVTVDERRLDRYVLERLDFKQ